MMMMMMIHLKGRFELKVVVFFVILHAPLPENIDLLWFAVMNCLPHRANILLSA